MFDFVKNFFKRQTMSEYEVYLSQATSHADLERREKLWARKHVNNPFSASRNPEIHFRA